MSDSVPRVTKEDLDRIIRRDYSQYEESAVREILNLYHGTELNRIQAAALKEGQGSLERLMQMIDLANQDYRDLLVAAEYPAQSLIGIFCYHTPAEKKADEKQYYDWFHK